MFTIKNLNVSIEDKEIIKGLDLEIKPGEIHAIMGPNGAGKSSLSEALMGHPSLKVHGSIKLDGEELAELPVDQRAKKGIFLAFQNPEEVEGVKVSNLIRKALSAKEGVKEKDLETMVKAHEELVENAKKLGMDKTFVSREVNVGFSGGEKKRMEMLQMLALKPKVIILDEVDSGLDVDGIKMVSDAIATLNDGTRCFLIITHYPRILKHVKPDFVHILAHGKIILSGDEKLAHDIEEHGYAKYLKGNK
ncbi:Fe-S cluster assembly ATPase SufC [Candidatus Micrarchaeota archaeon]|nr:Fe-S cluster assembly ATPase SufC [Candidatus Micrarchaeota archaeon]